MRGGLSACTQKKAAWGRNKDGQSSACHGRRGPAMSEGLYAVLFIGGTVLFGVVGVLVGRRIVRHHVAEGHNDVLVPLFMTAGVIYAVLLGFTVVAEWEFL